MKKLFLSSNIKYLRERRGYLQGELGKAVGNSRSYISMYETGSRLPSLEVFLEMVEIFGVSSDELLYTDLAANEGKPDKNSTRLEDKMANMYATKGEMDLVRANIVELAKQMKEHTRMMASYNEDIHTLDERTKKLRSLADTAARDAAKGKSQKGRTKKA